MVNILMVLSGADHWTLADGTKDPSGFWAEEFVVPHRVFREAGYNVTIAAPVGGKPTADPLSLKEEVVGGEAKGYVEYINSHAVELRHFTPLPNVDTSKYDAIFIPGGHGPMEDLAYDPDLGRILTEFNDKNKVIASLCHGPAALLSASMPGGRWLFEGKKLTVFTDTEESLNKTADRAPWLAEKVLRARGAVVQSADEAWDSHVVVDGNLFSGQNPASSKALAEKVVDTLSK